MSEDAKKALRAAALAGMDASARDYANRVHGGEPGPGNTALAAAAVAAFHRKRAADLRSAGLYPLANAHDEIAAAVEDAARDA